MTRFALAVALASACGGEAPITVIPDFAAAGALEGPVSITILPYSPGALRDSLTALTGPPPRFHALEAELRAFTPPDLVDTGTAIGRWSATRDSVRALADTLRNADRRSESYRAGYGRFRALYQRFAERSAARERVLGDATAGTRDLARRAGAAADSLRRWERDAWHGYDAAAQSQVLFRGHEPIELQGPSGAALDTLLPPGAWWIVASARVPGNPFLELRWEVAVVSAGGLPLRVPLDGRNVEVGWRH